MEQSNDPRQDLLNRSLASGKRSLYPWMPTAMSETVGSKSPFYVDEVQREQNLQRQQDIYSGQFTLVPEGKDKYKFTQFDDVEIDPETFAEAGMEQAIKYNSTQGWGEMNRDSALGMIRFFETGEGNFIYDIANPDNPANITQDYWGGVGHGIKKWFVDSPMDARIEQIKTEIDKDDPEFTEDIRIKETDSFLNANDGVRDVLSAGGINLYEYTRFSKNKKAMRFAINQAVIDATQNLRLKKYEEQTGFIEKIGESLYYGIQDPLLVRDMIVTTALTAGLGTAQMGAARLATALGQGTVTGTRAMTAARIAANALQVTSPFTGLTEGVIYKGLQATLPNIGKAGVRTALARAFAIGTEAGIQGGLVGYNDAKNDFEWRKLLFQDQDAIFKPDWGAVAANSAAGFALGGLMMGTMRFGLGLAGGDLKLIRKGDWKTYWNNVGSSLDTWARTDKGLTVWGETLSGGRGIILGNMIDKYMKNAVDGRDFTSILMNGKRLWTNGVFTPEIMAKTNFDADAARKVADAYADATGLPGEILMKMDTRDSARMIFDNFTDPEFLKQAGMTYDDAQRIFSQYAKRRNVVGRAQISPTELAALPKAVREMRAKDDVSNISQIMRLEIANRRLNQLGISPNRIENNFKRLASRDVDFGSEVDRDNYFKIADYTVNREIASARTLDLMSYAIDGRPDMKMPDGTIIKAGVVRDALRKAVRLDDVPEGGRLFITDAVDGKEPTFVISVAKDGTLNRHAAELKMGNDGRVFVDIEATKFNDYQPENIRTASDMMEISIAIRNAVDAEYAKVVKERKAKTKTELDELAKTSDEMAEAISNIGKLPTRNVLAAHFGLTFPEATVAEIMMETLGMDLENMILRIARADGERAATMAGAGAKASIEWANVKSGIVALIRSTKESDFGSLAHEMGHYNRLLFIGNTEEHVKLRASLGITDDMWSKFQKWVGYEGVWETEVSKMGKEQRVAEEKFANAWAYYIRSIMFGDGKSKDSSLHRLFSALGDHLGDLGKKMQSQVELEKGLVMTPEAKQVYDILFLRSEAKITKFWDSAVKGAFRNLPTEDRAKLGEQILGTEAYNTWLAKQEVETETAKAKVDKPVAEMAKVKKEKIGDIINRIKDKISGKTYDPTKKAIAEAYRAGIPIEQIEAQINAIRARLDGDMTFADSPNRPAAGDSYFASHVENLSDEQLRGLAEGTVLKPIPGVVRWFYNPDTKSMDVGFPKVTVSKTRVDNELNRRNLRRAALKRLAELKKAEESRSTQAAPTAKPDPNLIPDRFELREAEAIEKIAAEEALIRTEVPEIEEPASLTPEEALTSFTENVDERFVSNEVPVEGLNATETVVLQARETVRVDVESVETSVLATVERAADPTVPLEQVDVVPERVEPAVVNVDAVPAQTAPRSAQLARKITRNLEQRSNETAASLPPEVVATVNANRPVVEAASRDAELRVRMVQAILDDPRNAGQNIDPDILNQFINERSRFFVADTAVARLGNASDEDLTKFNAIDPATLKTLDNSGDIETLIRNPDNAEQLEQAVRSTGVDRETVDLFARVKRSITETARDHSNAEDEKVLIMREPAYRAYEEANQKLSTATEEEKPALTKIMQDNQSGHGKYVAAQERIQNRLATGEEIATIQKETVSDRTIAEIMQEREVVEAGPIVTTRTDLDRAREALGVDSPRFPRVIVSEKIAGTDEYRTVFYIQDVTAKPSDIGTAPIVVAARTAGAAGKPTANDTRLIAALITHEIVNNGFNGNITAKAGELLVAGKMQEAVRKVNGIATINDNPFIYHGVLSLLSEERAFLDFKGNLPYSVGEFSRLLEPSASGRTIASDLKFLSDRIKNHKSPSPAEITPRRLAYLLMTNEDFNKKVNRLLASESSQTNEIGVSDVIAKLYRTTEGIDAYFRRLLGVDKNATPVELYSAIIDWATKKDKSPLTGSLKTTIARLRDSQSVGRSGKEVTGEATSEEGVGIFEQLSKTLQEKEEQISVTSATAMDAIQAILFDFLDGKTAGEGKISLQDYFLARIATIQESGSWPNNVARKIKETTGVDITVEGTRKPEDAVKTPEKILSEEMDALSAELEKGIPDSESMLRNMLEERFGIGKKKKTGKKANTANELMQAVFDKSDPEQVRIEYDIGKKIRRSILMGEYKTLDSALKVIEESNSAFAELAKTLRQAKRKSRNIGIAPISGDRYASGFFDSNTNTIFLYYSKVSNFQPHIIIHEALHAFSLSELERFDNWQLRGIDYINDIKQKIDDEDAIRRVVGITEIDPVLEIARMYYEFVDSTLELDDKLELNNPLMAESFVETGEYGLYSMHEFVSEAISNPNFAKTLNYIPPFGVKQTSGLDSLYNAIVGTMGIENPNTNAMLKGLLDNVQLMLETRGFTSEDRIKTRIVKTIGLINIVQPRDRKSIEQAFSRGREILRKEADARQKLRAANGRLVQAVEENALYQSNLREIFEGENFQRWFKDSKVIHGSKIEGVGEPEDMPLRMFHGTPFAGFDEFKTFDWSRSRPDLLFGNGAYFTDDPDLAATYTKERGTDKLLIINKKRYRLKPWFDDKIWSSVLEYEEIEDLLFQTIASKVSRMFVGNEDFISDLITTTLKNNIGAYQTDKAALFNLTRVLSTADSLIDSALKNSGYRTDVLNSIDYMEEALTSLGIMRLPEKAKGIYPVFLSIKNPLDMDNDRLDASTLIKTAEKLGFKDLRKFLEKETQSLDYTVDQWLTAIAKENPEDFNKFVTRVITESPTVRKIISEAKKDSRVLSKEEFELEVFSQSYRDLFDAISNRYPTFESRMGGTYTRELNELIELQKNLRETIKTLEVSSTVKQDFPATEIFEKTRQNNLEHRLILCFQDMGYDGITHIGGLRMGSVQHRVFIAWKDNQIKSQLNRGNYSESGNILEQKKLEEFLGNNSIAVDSGNQPLVLYHSSSGTGRWDPDKIGLWFSSDEDISKKFGEVRYKAYTNLTNENTFVVDTGNTAYHHSSIPSSLLSPDIFKQLVQVMLDKPMSDKAENFWKSKLNLSNEELKKDFLSEDVEDFFKRIEYGYTFTTDDIAKAAKMAGYKGVWFKNVREGNVAGDQWIIFDKEAILPIEGENMLLLQAKPPDIDPLLDAVDLRRRNLRAMGLHEETTPKDMEMIQRMVHGLDPVDLNQNRVFDNIKTQMQSTILKEPSKNHLGKTYRQMTDSERRDFVANTMIPMIRKAMGDRNTSAGIYSAVSDTTFGKKVNSLIGGAVNYADTADSSSIILQFISKIFDPMMDMRNGELNGKFNLFSIDKLNAESNNLLLRSGLIQVRDKILSRVKKEAELRNLNDVAWIYLTRRDSVPAMPNRDLVLELIDANNKFNEITVELLSTYGYLSKGTDPIKYGTPHKASYYAEANQKEFVDALVNWAVNKSIKSNEISLLTSNALGWVQIKRDASTDEITSIIIPEGSPLVKLMEDDSRVGKRLDWNKKTKEMFSDLTKLTDKEREAHNKGLVSAEDYSKDWKDAYGKRGDGYTAIRQSMEIAKNRYLGIDFTDSKSGGPRRLAIGEGRNYDMERIITHDEIVDDPNMHKFFNKQIFQLQQDNIRGRITDALMTKYLTEFFGTRMSMDDFIQIASTIGEEVEGRVHMSQFEMQSRQRGYDRVRDAWDHSIGNWMSSKDSVDKFYEVALRNSRIPLTIASGFRAAVTSVPETARAILTSNKNRSMLGQLLPNMVKMIKLIGPGGKERRLAKQQIISATHWIRGLSTDHMLNRNSLHPDNPFAGTAFGQGAGGMVGNFVNQWRAAGEANKAETNWLQRVANRASAFSSSIGAPLAFVNDVTTLLHIWNAQENLTTNSASFLKMAEMIEKNPARNYSDYAALAKKCGLTAKEALDLRTAGLMDPKYIKILIQAAGNQSLYSDGILDARKMYIWAGEDVEKVEAINRMGGFINMTARHTNTEPTLLDIRVNQSLYARTLGQYMQFLLSFGVQEIGRRRRTLTSDYSKHLLGLMLMEVAAYGTTRALSDLEDDDRGGYDEFVNNPVDYSVRVATSLPLLGSYAWLSQITRQAIMGTSEYFGGPGSEQEFRLPDLIGGPASTAPRRIGEIPSTIKSMYNYSHDVLSDLMQE